MFVLLSQFQLIDMGMCHITALLKSFGISKKEKQTKFLFLRNPMPTPFPHETILDLAVVMCETVIWQSCETVDQALKSSHPDPH